MNTQLSAQGSLQKVERLIDTFYDVCSERGVKPVSDWHYYEVYHREIIFATAYEVELWMEAGHRAGVKVVDINDDLWAPAPGPDIDCFVAEAYEVGFGVAQSLKDHKVQLYAGTPQAGKIMLLETSKTYEYKAYRRLRDLQDDFNFRIDDERERQVRAFYGNDDNLDYRVNPPVKAYPPVECPDTEKLSWHR